MVKAWLIHRPRFASFLSRSSHRRRSRGSAAAPTTYLPRWFDAPSDRWFIQEVSIRRNASASVRTYTGVVPYRLYTLSRLNRACGSISARTMSLHPRLARPRAFKARTFAGEIELLERGYKLINTRRWGRRLRLLWKPAIRLSRGSEGDGELTNLRISDVSREEN